MKTAAHNHLNFAASHRPTPYRGGMGRLVLPTPLSRDVSWDDWGRCLRRLGLGTPEQGYLVPDYAAQVGTGARCSVDVAAILDGRPCGGNAATLMGRPCVWPLWSRQESNPDLAICKTRAGLEVTKRKEYA